MRKLKSKNILMILIYFKTIYQSISQICGIINYLQIDYDEEDTHAMASCYICYYNINTNYCICDDDAEGYSITNIN